MQIAYTVFVLVSNSGGVFFNVGVAGVGEHLGIRLIIGMLTAEVVCIVSSPIRMASLL